MLQFRKAWYRSELLWGNVSIFHDVDIPSNDSVISNVKMELIWKYLTVLLVVILEKLKFLRTEFNCFAILSTEYISKEVARQDWYFGQGQSLFHLMNLDWPKFSIT